MQNIQTAQQAQNSNAKTHYVVKSGAGYTALTSFMLNLYELAAPRIKELPAEEKRILSGLASEACSHISNVCEAAGKMAVHMDKTVKPDDMFFGLSEILLLAETQRELNDTAIYLLENAK